jgi:hypothetical protein
MKRSIYRRTTAGNYLTLIQGGCQGDGVSKGDLKLVSRNGTLCPGVELNCHASNWDAIRATWLIMKRLVS